MLIVRGTRKLRDRVKGPLAGDDDESTTVLGDWFATALFWQPQVALLVNARTLLPVFMPLAPARTLLDRASDAIGSVLRRHGVDEEFLAAEREAMAAARLAPTNNRSVVGVMNELTFQGEVRWNEGVEDLEELSLQAARVLLGPLLGRTGSPNRELAAVLQDQAQLAEVIPLHGGQQSEPAPTAPASTGEVVVYQLKITLSGIKPPIWHRVLVDGAGTLADLHGVIQAAFGWAGYHLHEFEIDNTSYGVPDPDGWGPPTVDERTVRLDSITGEGGSFRYTYDFGDNWEHKITIEKTLPKDSTTTVPACIGGRRACPPEDCGGPCGYADLLNILTDPTHPEHQERLNWLGDSFDPEAFDPDNFRSSTPATFPASRTEMPRGPHLSPAAVDT